MSNRLELVYKHVSELKDYAANPRNNAAAIDAVKASILTFGFRVPAIVDANNVLVAGHTRVAAVKRILQERPDLAEELGEVPCFVADDLDETQLRAFRLIDNKVAEIATWDFDLLAQEVAGLSDVGINMAEFGWSQEELDCLTNVVSSDCLSAPLDVGNDGVNEAVKAKRSLHETADGLSIRIAFGSLAFFVLKDDFDAWNDAIHKEAGYSPEGVIDNVAKALGLYDAKQKRDLMLGSVVEDQTAAQVQA